MLVFLMYDNENYIDLERILSSTLNDMSKLDTEFLFDVEGSSVEAISLMRLVCYEKHRDIYRFFFINEPAVDYDYRVGKRLVHNRIPDNFIQINKSAVVNMSFILRVEDNDIYLSGEKEPRKVGRVYKQKLIDELSRRQQSYDNKKKRRNKDDIEAY